MSKRLFLVVLLFSISHIPLTANDTREEVQQKPFYPSRFNCNQVQDALAGAIVRIISNDIPDYMQDYYKKRIELLQARQQQCLQAGFARPRKW